MACRQPGDKPLSEPTMVNSLTHICVTWPQWVKANQVILIILWFSGCFPNQTLSNQGSRPTHDVDKGDYRHHLAILVLMAACGRCQRGSGGYGKHRVGFPSRRNDEIMTTRQGYDVTAPEALWRADFKRRSGIQVRDFDKKQLMLIEYFLG